MNAAVHQQGHHCLCYISAVCFLPVAQTSSATWHTPSSAAALVRLSCFCPCIKLVAVALTAPWSQLIGRAACCCVPCYYLTSQLTQRMHDCYGQHAHPSPLPQHATGVCCRTLKLVRSSGLADKVVRAGRGRAVQMNAGADAASGALLCFLHADTQPPTDLVSTQSNALHHLLFLSASAPFVFPGCNFCVNNRCCWLAATTRCIPESYLLPQPIGELCTRIAHRSGQQQEARGPGVPCAPTQLQSAVVNAAFTRPAQLRDLHS
jgi:hypothetical protein